jgi:hypothetical protein
VDFCVAQYYSKGHSVAWAVLLLAMAEPEIIVIGPEFVD